MENSIHLTISQIIVILHISRGTIEQARGGTFKKDLQVILNLKLVKEERGDLIMLKRGIKFVENINKVPLPEEDVELFTGTFYSAKIQEENRYFAIMARRDDKILVYLYGGYGLPEVMKGGNNVYTVAMNAKGMSVADAENNMIPRHYAKFEQNIHLWTTKGDEVRTNSGILVENIKKYKL